MNIMPIITAILAFNLGPPGTLIILASIGIKKVNIPIIVMINPIIMKTMFKDVIKIFILV